MHRRITLTTPVSATSSIGSTFRKYLSGTTPSWKMPYLNFRRCGYLTGLPVEPADFWGTNAGVVQFSSVLFNWSDSDALIFGENLKIDALGNANRPHQIQLWPVARFSSSSRPPETHDNDGRVSVLLKTPLHLSGPPPDSADVWISG